MENIYMYDTGIYNKNPDEYSELMRDLYARHPTGVTLTAEYADFINQNMLQFLIRLSRYKFAAKMIKKTDSILEVGSGSGLGSIFLSQHCQFVTGIEIKTTEVEDAKRINTRENVEFACADFYNWDLQKKYDAIINLDVIEHMTIEQGNLFIKKMSKHLNHSGMVIIGTPSIYSYQYQSPASKASHVKCYDQRELVELIEHYFERTLVFSMNDEVVHTGFAKLAWYYFVIGFYPKA